MEYGLVVLWLVTYFALGLAGLPLAVRLFRGFPDRGAALSVPLSLAVVGVVAYWVGHLSLTAGLVAGLVVLVGLSAISLRGLDLDEFDFGGLVGPAVVFAVAFCFLVAVRAVDPSVHPGAGEKFLDFGLLESLLRTSALPPEDFWFAGQPVQYYYGGHLLAALLAKVTFTPARYAYNLALAGFFAMVVTAAYGLAGAIAASRGRSARVAGVLAAFLVGVASNLETPGRAVLLALPHGLTSSVSAWLGVDVTGLSASLTGFSYWNASRVIPGTINEFPLFAWLNGDLHAHMMSTPFLLLAAALWFAYYCTPADALRRRRLVVFGAIPPITGLLTVINTWSFPTAVGIGWLAMIFADADPKTLLPWVGNRIPRGESRFEREATRTALALAVAAAVLVVGIGWSLPFWLDSASGRAVAFLPDRSPLGALLLVHGAFLAMFAPYLTDRGRRLLDTPTKQAVLVTIIGLVALAWLGDAAALAVFGPLLVVGWLVLATQRNSDGVGESVSAAVGERGPTESDGGERAFGARASSVERGEARPEGAWSETPSASRHHGRRDAPLERPRNSERRSRERSESDGGVESSGSTTPTVGFETVLVVAGAGLGLLVEFVYVKGNAGPGRLNTVFKSYAQIWVLFATAAGAIGAWLVDARLPNVSDARTVMAERWRLAGRGLVAVLVVSASVYGVLAVSDHFTSQSSVARVNDPTLDSLAFVSSTHPDEAAAITWLDARPGQPHLVSVPSCYCNDNDALTDYHWVNAPSSLTGVPTVVGWDHEVGYRGEASYLARVEDVRRIYEGSPEQQVQLLRKYDVRYIYVGPNERTAYGTTDFAMLHGVSVARQWDAVTIYRVNRNELSP